MFALFGYVGTPTAAAALPMFTAAKVPFVGAFTGAESLRAPFNRYIFNVRASYYDETEKIVEQLVDRRRRTSRSSTRTTPTARPGWTASSAR